MMNIYKVAVGNGEFVLVKAECFTISQREVLNFWVEDGKKLACAFSAWHYVVNTEYQISVS